MTASADLSKLRIDRDAPSPSERKALGRNVLLFVAAIAVVAAAAFVVRARSVPAVQVVVANAGTAAGGGAAGGGTSVTANGYVVARTKASVSAKIAGRL